jgi:glyoxylase-like metal-dependent hydrolase (beta-lactamase superfamily II)
MLKPIVRGVFMVGGSALSDDKDASVYLVDGRDSAALIDAGAGDGTDDIIMNIEKAGVDPARVKTLILTHCHVDHSGGIPALKERLGLRTIAHARCAEILARGNDPRTAASWYGMKLPAIRIDEPFDADERRVPLGDDELVCIFTPGHSPGSISIYLDRDGQRALFGQDVHGPISPTLGSDIRLYKQSLNRLLSLQADVLCEGHFGVFRPRAEVERYIKSYL